MQITKTDSGFVVQIPDDVVVALALRDGDEVEVRRKDSLETAALDAERRQWAGDTLRRLARPLPAGYMFDREEANAR